MKKAFTLVELMVIIVIIGLIVTASFVSFGSYKHKKNAQAVASSIADSLAKTRVLAVSPDQDISNLKQVEFSIANKKITSQYILNAGTSPAAVILYKIPGNVTVDDKTIDFIANNGPQMGKIDSASPEITVTDASGQNQVKIGINALSGKITIN